MTDDLIATLWAAAKAGPWVHPVTGPVWGTVLIEFKDGCPKRVESIHHLTEARSDQMMHAVKEKPR